MGEIWVIFCGDSLAKGKTTLLKYIFKAPDLKPGIQVWTSLD